MEMLNKDNFEEAVNGLNYFTRNYCVDVKETCRTNEFTFRCSECVFCKSDNKCMVKEWVRNNLPEYDLKTFGAMGSFDNKNVKPFIYTPWKDINQAEEPKNNKEINFTPNPIPTYLNYDKNCLDKVLHCKCCSDPLDYDRFLISEYGIDKYLQVKKEEKQTEEFFKRFLSCLFGFGDEEK